MYKHISITVKINNTLGKCVWKSLPETGAFGWLLGSQDSFNVFEVAKYVLIIGG